MVLNVDNFPIRLIFSDAQFKGGEQNVVRDGPSSIGQRFCSVSKKTGTSHCDVFTRYIVMDEGVHGRG